MNTKFAWLLWSWLVLLACPLRLVAQTEPAAAAPKNSLEGQWKGPLTVPGGKLPVVITVTELANGSRFGLLDVPMQRISRAMMVMQVRGDTVSFVSEELGCSYLCRRSADGQQLQGTWVQQGYKTDLTLQYVPLPPSPPKNFKFPPPYRVEEVTFANTKDDVRLSGTLTTPPGEGPFPAVVLLSDMGPQDRDATQGEYKLFGALADYLTRRGIAVLRLDDRGVGQSTGSWSTATTTDRVKDAQIALNFLRTRPLIDFAQLGLIGHGEGGNVALLAAAQPLAPSFVITLAAAGLPGFEVMMQRPAGFLAAGEADTAQENLMRRQLLAQQQIIQKAAELRAKGSNAAQIETFVSQQQMRQRAEEKKRLDAVVRQQKTMLEIVRQTPDNAQAQAILTNMLSQYNRALPASAVQARAAQMVSPWHRSYLTFTPQTSLENVKAAVLLLHGTDDNQLSANNLTQLEKALKGNKRVEVRKLEGVNHQFQAPPMEWPMLNGEQKPVISPLVQQTIVEWIKARKSELTGR